MINYENQSTTPFTCGSNLYIIDATDGNISLTLDPIIMNLMRYLIIRIDNTSNIVTINCNTGNTLYTGESSFNFYGFSNIMILSYNTTWIMTLGYTKDR